MSLTKLPKRLQKELQYLKKQKCPGIEITVNENNYRHFYVTMDGPNNSPYKRGIFELELFLTNKYPMRPPKVHFLTKLSHPNIDKIGRVCLDILKDKWTPALNILKVCLALQRLLAEPILPDPLDSSTPYYDVDKERQKGRYYTRHFALTKMKVEEIKAVINNWTRRYKVTTGWITDFDKYVINFLLLKRLQY